jgi:ABC-type uncharacterized transport system involved in gliding motility auxiliary subunit
VELMQRQPQGHSYTKIFAIVGLAMLVAGLIVMVAFSQIRLAAIAVMAGGFILLVMALVIDFAVIKAAFTGRRGRLGTGSTLMAMIFLGIIVLANGVVLFASQDPKILAATRYDVTKLSQFTLTQQTKDVLLKLDKPVKALCFFVPSKDQYGLTAYAESLLLEYQQYNKLITIEVIDPDEHPDRARKYGVFQYQTVVFENGDHRRQVISSQIIQFNDQGIPQQIEAEHAFTSAILEVTGTAQKKVYFVTGNGEADINGNYSSALRGLRDDLYIVNTVNLLTDPVVPADAAVLVLAAPQTPLTAGEVSSVLNYINQGGHLLVLTDPNYPDGINEILAPFGMKMGTGTIVDIVSSVAPNNDMPLVPEAGNFFSATMGLAMTTYFPTAVGILPTDNATTLTPLVHSSLGSWLQKEYDSTKTPAFNEQTDVPGPINIGAMMDRLIAIGDSDFASNDHFLQVNNGDLFLNSVNWLAEETKLITIRRTALPFRRLTVNEDQTNFITYSSLIIPSAVVLLIGAIVWWYRR